MSTAQVISAHISIDIVEAGLGGLSGLSTGQTLIVKHHAVDLLGHVNLVVSWLSLLLISLALLTITVLIEARGCARPTHRLLLFFKHLVAGEL